MQNAQKVALVITLLIMILCSWFGVLDKPASKSIDIGIKRALVSFTAARSLNALISVAQGTEVVIQPLGLGITLAPGQILDPVNDIIENFSTLMVIASVALVIQKILITIGGYWGISLVLTVTAVAWGWLYFKDKSIPAWLSRILVLLLMIRFALPVVTVGTDYLFQKYMATSYVENLQAISNLPNQPVNHTQPKLSIPQAKAQSSWLDQRYSQAKKMFDNAKIKSRDSLDANKQLESLKTKAEKWIKNMLDLISIFLLQTLIIPIAMIWTLFLITKGLFISQKQYIN